MVIMAAGKLRPSKERLVSNNSTTTRLEKNEEKAYILKIK
ncbi:MAG: hypothetical protein ACJAUP_000172 [Cellvibrionaceae bacterium]|jgi:hypothetical protein